jgi:acetyl-CoA C-acetyltransferase
MPEPVILSACRTPIGRFQGGLSSLKVTEIGARVVREALRRAGVAADQVDEVILGCVLQAGLGQNPARQAAIAAEIPVSVPSFTVNKVCGSGLKSVMLAAQAIKAGDADLFVVGGMESMSRAPYYLLKARDGLRLGHDQLVDGMIWDGLWDHYNDFHMGITAEMVCDKYGVTRENQDRYAAESHRKAAAATESGKFKDEIVPIVLKDRKGNETVVDKDEGIRADASVEGLGKLRPAFKKDGSVTPGNASQISDGASALVVASAEKAKELGAKPIARITGYSTGGLEPEWVMMAPVPAVKSLCDRLGKSPGDFDLVELNEAFAAQSCALLGELELDAAKVNVHGGAVALGHPIGASGARILTTLLYAMKDRGAATGLASLCLGGGNAVAMSVERV